ncbi:MAG: serine/threonine protein kinase, partial [Proteobacteria bacterium]|nr:serine/threonine protein kinase [Pseudomonadota bacterium]
IMHKVLREDPTAPSELNVQIPKSFDKLIGKALAKRPEDRFQSAREFAVALQAVIGGVVADSEATIAIAPAAAPAAPRARPSSETPAEPPVARPSPALPPARSPALTFAVIGGVVVLGLGAALYYVNRSSAPSAPLSEVPPAAAPSVGSVPANATAPAPQAARPTDLVISAVGFADPSDPRYGSDPGLLRAELREDARRQLVEKAIALYVQSGSLLQNYDRLQGRLLARSGEFIDTVIQEEAPRTGKDGLVSVTTRASVRVRDVQKTLNQMSREERIDFIRNNGDPKISVAISTRPETGEAQRSPVAENLLKEHIQSFGFRTFNESGGETRADFMVTGEAKFKKLSTTLAASGLTIEKTVLTSWTVKCIDKLTGEEIYFNTQIPEKQSWASEDQALAEIGRLIGEEFSKNFFLQHFHFTGQKVVLRLAGLPDRTIGEKLQREITGLRSVLDVKGIDVSTLEVRLAGSAGSPADLVAAGVTQPINHKLGRTCLSVNGQNGAEVILALDATCLDSTVLGKLDSLPAAALYDAPPVRRNAIVKNPETLRKMAI